jgi:hypothetical protein
VLVGQIAVLDDHLHQQDGGEEGMRKPAAETAAREQHRPEEEIQDHADPVSACMAPAGLF